MDARNWFDAEIAYQKTRAGFVSSSFKTVLALGIGAAVLGFLILVALTVGLLIALTPLITAWGATAIVVLVLGAIVFVMAKAAASRWAEIMDAIREGREG